MKNSIYTSLDTRVSNLKTDKLIEPLGIGTPFPLLSWEVTSSCRGIKSIAVEIEAKTIHGQLVWDSGKMHGCSSNVIYGGEPLKSWEKYIWKVKVILSDHTETEWSDEANFECGALCLADWQDYWVLYNSNLLHKEKLSVIHMRKEFSLLQKPGVRRARAFVAATAPQSILGNDAMRMNLYELHLNRRKVGQDLMNPGQLSLHRGRALFRAFDISEYLQEHNAIGIIYAAGKISVMVRLDYDDGTTVITGCDSSWKWNYSGGPFTRLWKHDIKEFGGRGEIYDARLELSGWDCPDFDDTSWKTVSNGSPPDLLAPQYFAVQSDEIINPKSISAQPDGKYIVDFGRCFNGFVKIKVNGEPGNRVVMRFAEALNHQNDINCYSTSTDPDFDQLNVYVKKSPATETYMPVFATHGFRYAEITGNSGVLDKSDIHGVSICAHLPNRSKFYSSESWLNRLHQLCVNTFKSNMVSVPTDCPGRERNGWLADAYLVTDGEYINFDAAHLFEKWYNDVADMQESDGYIPYVCPFPFPPYGKDIVWSACFTLSVWEAYLNTGDKRMLNETYPTMVKLGILLSRFTDFKIPIADYVYFGGDHMAERKPTSEFMGYAYCYRNLDLLSHISNILNHSENANVFREKAQMIKNHLNANFITDSGQYDNDSQSANAHALYFGIADEIQRDLILSKLAFEVKKSPHFSSGMLGYYALLKALSENNCDDLIWDIVKSDQPGTWNYWVTHFDATTAPEKWSPSRDKSSGLCSWNHPMLIGGLASWLYRGLGGITPLKAGYEKIAIHPFFAPGVEFISTTIDCPKGLVVSEWKRDGDHITLKVSIPVDSVAEITIPSSSPSEITAGDSCILSTEGVSLIKQTSETSVFSVESGKYCFRFSHKQNLT